MTERPSLFRQEALEFHAGRPGEGGVLRIDPPWTRWLYWIVLALVAAGVAVAATARTSETTSGPALIDLQRRTFVALVPEASPDLRRGRPVRLQVAGPQARRLAARLLSAEVVDQAGVRRAGFSSSKPAVLVRGLLERRADLASSSPSRRAEGRAVVVLRSRRVVALFLRQLRGMLATAREP